MSSRRYTGRCAYCGGEAVWKNTLGQYCSKTCKERARQPRHYDAIKARRSANMQRVNEEKLRRGCENPDCGWQGEFHSTMLDFDHLCPDSKLTDVSKLVNSGAALETIYAEMGKCRILCANCHREHSYRQQKDET